MITINLCMIVKNEQDTIARSFRTMDKRILYNKELLEGILKNVE